MKDEMLKNKKRTHAKRCDGTYCSMFSNEQDEADKEGVNIPDEEDVKVPEKAPSWETADGVEEQGLKMLKYDLYSVEIDEWKALAVVQKKQRASLRDMNDQVDRMLKNDEQIKKNSCFY